MPINYDYIIAGGGSAGGTLAAKLAEKSDAKILLIEGGGNGKSLFTEMPAGNGFIFGNPSYDWMFESVPQNGLNGNKLYYPRGKGLGGSSLLNGMIYIRGNAIDFDRWRQKGLEGWSYADVLPYFKQSSNAKHRKGSAFHSANGPLKISPAGNNDIINKAFIDACMQAGAEYNDDFNGIKQNGVGRYDSTIFGGIRSSSRKSYLDKKLKNLTILKNERVLKVIIEKSRAIGIQLKDRIINAQKEIILSLGAFATPQCLMLSGIGPEKHLKYHGIDLKLDLPGVGSSLYDHPNFPVHFSLKNKNLSMSKYQRLDKAIIMGLEYIFFKKGPAASSFWSTSLFHALYNQELPEIQINFTPMVVKEEGKNAAFSIQNFLNLGKAVIARGKSAIPGVQLDINLQQPKSVGSIKLSSSNPYEKPLIDPNYLSDQRDIEDFTKAFKHLRFITQQDAFKDILSSELSPGNNIKTDDEIHSAIRNLTTTGHHPVSTCRMGNDNDKGAVLDNNFKLRGIKNLRVVDASAFPDQINGNINAAVIMMGEKAADIILDIPPLKREDPRETNIL
jgi:choline dehydrogenase|tara:strand:- start:834 stop:2513 length:1680 start_codon:yes stop_codon:yes gene_type:complete